jgi:peptide/nickel transport system permease protein
VRYLAKRALISLIIFFFVVNLVFFLPRLVPGNAAFILASSVRLPGVTIHLLEQRLGLNQSLAVQYYLYLKNTFTTFPPDFGFSYLYYPSSATEQFMVRIPWTLFLIAVSLPLSFGIAYFLAKLTATRRGGKLEAVAMYSAIALNSTPIFWVAMILLYMFSIWNGWFPLYGNVNPQTTGMEFYASVIWHAILPVVALTASLFGAHWLILRGSTQEVLGSDYVTAAKLRGLNDGTLSSNYIIRNSLLPLVSVMSFSLASLVSRVVLVEVVFGYPGVGDLLVDGVISRDYPVLEASFFYLTVMILIGGLIGDYLLTRLDPRLRT